MLTRRNFLRGLVAAPALVHINNIMPIKVIRPGITLENYYDRILKPLVEARIQDMWDDLVIYGNYFQNQSGNRIPPHEAFA